MLGYGLTMSTDKKKIEKRWRITRWNFDPESRELISTDVSLTKPMTERRARNLVKGDLLGQPSCWKIERLYR